MTGLRTSTARTRWQQCRALVLISTATLAGCGAAPDSSGASTAEPVPQTGELLIASAPTGWVAVSALNQPNLKIAEYANPENLTPDQVDSVRFESQLGQPLPDPIDLTLGLREELRSNCKGFRDFPIFSGLENGYPTAVRLLLCRQQGDPPRGLVRMVKAIQGLDAFYIVTRSRSSAPFEAEAEPMSVEDMGGWSSWIGGVEVCDTRDPTHPCPGSPPADAASPPADAASPPADAGSPAADRESPAADAGSPAVETGPPSAPTPAATPDSDGSAE